MSVTMTMARQDVRSQTFETDEARWAALERRDHRADGTFFYAVRTTGIYCRPSCGARLARRDNVLFFTSRADAEHAGFRPCKRCRPELFPNDRRRDAITRACRLIENAETAPDLAELARASGLSRFHFHRVFKTTIGVTPRAYAAACRARRAQTELGRTETVTEAIYAAGYQSSSEFYRGAQARLGMTPQNFREGGKDAEIAFGTRACSLGTILVGATAKGICAIAFGDDPAALEADLHRRFPNATITPGGSAFQALLARVVQAVETPTRGFDLPLDIRGTAFQQRVWQELRAIAPGTTKSYAEIARAIGRPTAVRAVGTAIGANPIAFAIPCHRAIHSDGTMGGYHWGSARKRALLAREAPPLSLLATAPK